MFCFPLCRDSPHKDHKQKKQWRKTFLLPLWRWALWVKIEEDGLKSVKWKGLSFNTCTRTILQVLAIRHEYWVHIHGLPLNHGTDSTSGTGPWVPKGCLLRVTALCGMVDLCWSLAWQHLPSRIQPVGVRVSYGKWQQDIRCFYTEQLQELAT